MSLANPFYLFSARTKMGVLPSRLEDEGRVSSAGQSKFDRGRTIEKLPDDDPFHYSCTTEIMRMVKFTLLPLYYGG